MTINYLIKKKAPACTSGGAYARVYVRLRDGRGVDQSVRTAFIVECRQWNHRRGEVVPQRSGPNSDWQNINRQMEDLRSKIASKYIADSYLRKVGPHWLKDAVSDISGNGYKNTFASAYESFLRFKLISDARRNQYEMVRRLVIRFIYWEKHFPGGKRMHDVFCGDCPVDYEEQAGAIKISDFNFMTLSELWDFAKNEDQIFVMNKQYRKAFPEKKPPRKRGDNTLNEIFKKIRAFFHWCVNTGLIDKNPFDNFKINPDVYGTPVYITREELHQLHTADLSSRPRLQRQKDVFVFQCNVGCRVGDLRRFTKSNLVNGTLEYIPNKTVTKNPRTVVIPLNEVASDIVAKYVSMPDDRLLPCTSTQKYNKAIKEIFEFVGLDRKVTVLDSVTRKEKRVCLYEIASSHMARRTFAGNLYKKVKDPNLISSLTGHCDGSRAFSRYRAIDNDIKKELVELLE